MRPVDLLTVLYIPLIAGVQPTSAEPFTQDAIAAARVLPPQQLPDDQRLAPLKDLNGYFPFQPPASLAQWEKRAENVRRRILVATGLWPMPPRKPIQPTIHGRVDRAEYTVEKVFFESYPGFFVTGSLYRPKHRTGPLPAVLSPHGHFSNGRFHDHGWQEVQRQIFQGAERFEAGGRHPIQARCAQLARMGCVVFNYDMIGYADSQQISHQVAHGHSEPRPHLEGQQRWGLYTVQAEQRLQNVLGLQTFNSIRALDFIESLPEVDRSRIAVTGASGGGTQTMILSAMDPRVAVSFPAVMVSTAMQGGCTCENTTCLRVGTGNVEFAGLFAPKPLGMTAADDWTLEMATKGYPDLQKLYQLYGAKEKVRLSALTHFGHNYNYVSRGHMYHWLNKHLKLGLDEPIVATEYQPLSIEELSVWTGEHPQPSGGEEFESRLLRAIAEASDRQLNQLFSEDKEKFHQVVSAALTTILDCNWEEVGPVEREKVAKLEHEGFWLFKDILRNESVGSELPTLFLHPRNWNGQVVVWISGQGKVSLLSDAGKPRHEAMQLLDAGFSIATADLLYQGEFLGPDAVPRQQTRRVENRRDFAGYTFGYNPTLIAHRVRDIVTLVKFIHDDEHSKQDIHLLAVDGASPWAVLARAMIPGRIKKLAIDDGDFRFADLKSWRDPDFLPGAIKYGDLPTMLGLGGSNPVWMANRSGKVPESLFDSSDVPILAQQTTSPLKDAVSWLLR